MDGAQEVERKRTVRAVSAIVHTRARRRVSFGEPEENTGVRAEAAVCGAFVGRTGVWIGLWRAGESVTLWN